MQRLFGNKDRRLGFLPGRQRQPDVSDELWEKCAGCGEMIYAAEFEQNAHVCPKCDHHARLSARKRVEYLLDHRYVCRARQRHALTGRPEF